MSFSYLSGVITQTGTDTDLGGLNGLTGVTRIGSVTTGIQSYYIYDIGTNRLDIEGDLTIIEAGNAPRIKALEEKTKSHQIEINSVFKLVREVRTAGVVIGSMITVGTPVISAFLLKWID